MDAQLAAALGARRLSEAARAEVVGKLAPVSDGEAAEAANKVRRQLADDRFRRGLLRLVLHAHQGAEPDLTGVCGFDIAVVNELKVLVRASGSGDAIFTAEGSEATFDAGNRLLVRRDSGDAIDESTASAINVRLGALKVDGTQLLKLVLLAPDRIAKYLDDKNLPLLPDEDPGDEADDDAVERDVFHFDDAEAGGSVDGSETLVEPDARPARGAGGVKSQTTLAGGKSDASIDKTGPSSDGEETGHASPTPDRLAGREAGEAQSASVAATNATDRHAGERRPVVERSAPSGATQPADRRRSPPKKNGRAISYVSPQNHSGDEADADARSTSRDGTKPMSIAQAAVNAVMAHERARGRQPEEAAHNNPGWDVRSDGPSGTRWIEVKGVEGEWDADGVALSATQFTDATGAYGDRFWLYVVEHATDRDRQGLWCIQNPYEKVTQFRFDHGWRAWADETAGSARNTRGRRAVPDSPPSGPGKPASSPSRKGKQKDGAFERLKPGWRMKVFGGLHTIVRKEQTGERQWVICRVGGKEKRVLWRGNADMSLIVK